MTEVTTYLLAQGSLGVSTLVLGTVVILLYKKSERLQSRIEELQDLRLQYTKDIIKEQTAVLQGNAEANRILAEKIEIARSRGRV